MVDSAGAMLHINFDKTFLCQCTLLSFDLLAHVFDSVLPQSVLSLNIPDLGYFSLVARFEDNFTF